jgi:ABC-2 type transport system permease protein
MGIWSATSTTRGSAMQRERWHGTLELLVASPTHFALVLLPARSRWRRSASTAWSPRCSGAARVRRRPDDRHPLLFALSIPATVISIGDARLPARGRFVRYRTAWALGNMLEYPSGSICGFLVPLSLFPDWVRPISWVLAPTWGMNAIRESALGGSPLPICSCASARRRYIAIGVSLVDRCLRGGRAPGPRSRSRDAPSASSSSAG